MLKVYDTTLRDGTQAPHVILSPKDKIRIVPVLDNLGVDYIELGWPGSNEYDSFVFDAVKKLRKNNELKINAKIAAFGSTKLKNNKVDEDYNLNAIVKSGADTATIFGKTWILHIEKQLKISPEENLELIGESIRYLKKHLKEVIFDAEHFFDGYKDNMEYALKVLKAALDAGADFIVLCDTNGGCLHFDIEDIIKKVKEVIPCERLGFHAHNDSGNAVANTLSAVKLGIKHIQGTINGFGERCGNVDLCQVLPDLILKMNVKSKVKLEELYKVSHFVYNIAGVMKRNEQPYVGDNSFSHKGGVHVDAQKKDASYEHINPGLVGNKTHIILSELSGRANVAAILSDILGKNIEKDDKKVKNILSEFEKEFHNGKLSKFKEHQRLFLLRKYLGIDKPLININSWRIVSEKVNGKYNSESAISIKGISVKHKLEGGPVDASFHAIKNLILKEYPEIEEIKLVDFNTSTISEEGAASLVEVVIDFECNGRYYSTRAKSHNILEASLISLAEGFEYGILLKKAQSI